MAKMPDSFDGMIESKYVKKEDVDNPVLWTIKGFDQQNVAPPGETPEHKWICYFEDFPKGLVLNVTNLQILKAVYGGPNDAIGRPIVVYNDPNVSYAGRLVGGVRLRAPKQKPAPQRSHPIENSPPFNDDNDVPF